MNIFVLDENPFVSATMIDCVRLPKMITESAQMMAQALRNHGATDEQMPLTKSGTAYKGGYKHHPSTKWVSMNRSNFTWLCHHAMGMLDEQYSRFGTVHSCHNPIYHMSAMSDMIPDGELTPFALAMPDEFRPKHSTVTLPCDVDRYKVTHASGKDAVQSYRAYYMSKVDSKGGVHYRHTNPPDWWRGVEVTA